MEITQIFQILIRTAYLLGAITGFVLSLSPLYSDSPPPRSNFVWKAANLFVLVMHPLATIYALVMDIGYPVFNYVMLGLVILEWAIRLWHRPWTLDQDYSEERSQVERIFQRVVMFAYATYMTYLFLLMR